MSVFELEGKLERVWTSPRIPQTTTVILSPGTVVALEAQEVVYNVKTKFQ